MLVQGQSRVVNPRMTSLWTLITIGYLALDQSKPISGTQVIQATQTSTRMPSNLFIILCSRTVPHHSTTTPVAAIEFIIRLREKVWISQNYNIELCLCVQIIICVYVHYVYIVEVTWGDGYFILLYREISSVLPNFNNLWTYEQLRVLWSY